MPPRIISIDVPSRTHVDPSARLLGGAAWAFVEELTRDAYAFAGIDAGQPMRRDVVVIVRRGRP